MTDDEYYTPSHIVEAVRKVLGTIDLDPCSNSFANTIVQASSIITRQEDGLKTKWCDDCTVFLNPPSGDVKVNGKNVSKPIAFWNRLLQHRLDGRLKHGIFLCYIYNMMVTSCNPVISLSPFYNFPIAFLDKRLRFLSHTSINGVSHFTENDRPISGNFLVYVSGSINATDLFIQYFTPFGGVMLPTVKESYGKTSY